MNVRMGWVAVVVMAVVMSGCAQQESSPKQPAVTEQTRVLPETTDVAGGMAAAIPESAAAEEFLIADFDSGVKPNNIGGNFGAWDKDPTDVTQKCTEAFDVVNRTGEKGFSMRLDYDVDSPNPAYNGFWMFLQNSDARPYDALAFDVKGDEANGFTTVAKVELKNSRTEVGRYYITDIKPEWRTVEIPLKELKGITDLSDVTEFVIVFEDRMVSNKAGTIYLDNVRFLKKTLEANQ